MSPPPPDPPSSAPLTKGDLDAHEKHEEVSLGQMIGVAVGRIFRREALLTILVLAVGAGAALGARAWGQEKIDAGAATAVAPLKGRVEAVEQQVPQLRAEVVQLRAEVHEQRLETRDLYRAVMDGRRSVRLENPPVAAPLQDAGQ